MLFYNMKNVFLLIQTIKVSSLLRIHLTVLYDLIWQKFSKYLTEYIKPDFMMMTYCLLN